MKKIICSLFMLALVISTHAQSRLVTYEGGFYIQNGDTWKNYKPEKRDEVWATYKQTGADDNYFYLKNSVCEMCIPKRMENKIWIKMPNENWKKLHTVINIYEYCPVFSNNIFAYQNGFFVKNGNNWQEYDPKQKTTGELDNFTQYDIDENFYYIYNTRITLAIPRNNSGEFYFRRDGSWLTLYTPSAIYDAKNPVVEYVKGDYANNSQNQSASSQNSSNGQSSNSISNKWDYEETVKSYMDKTNVQNHERGTDVDEESTLYISRSGEWKFQNKKVTYSGHYTDITQEVNSYPDLFITYTCGEIKLTGGVDKDQKPLTLLFESCTNQMFIKKGEKTLIVADISLYWPLLTDICEDKFDKRISVHRIIN